MLNRTLIAVLLAFASAAQAGDPVPLPAVPSLKFPAELVMRVPFTLTVLD